MDGVLGTLLLVHQPGRHPRVVLLENQYTIHLDLRLIALRARQVDDDGCRRCERTIGAYARTLLAQGRDVVFINGMFEP